MASGEFLVFEGKLLPLHTHVGIEGRIQSRKALDRNGIWSLENKLVRVYREKKWLRLRPDKLHYLENS